MVKIGDVVRFITESGRETEAKVILVQNLGEGNHPEVLTVQFKTEEGFQREIGTIPHISVREDDNDGKKINCYTSVVPEHNTEAKPELKEESPIPVVEEPSTE